MIERAITGLTLDSREVQAGDVFVALSGHVTDGRHYIPEAIQQGAVAILCEALKTPSALHSVPIIQYSKLTDALGFMASRFFSEPSHAIPVIGITGTSGKTSCSHFIAQLLQDWNKPCGILGTLGIGYLNHLKATHSTTPDAISVHRHLASFRDQGAFSVVMEVSSHALTQKRVNGVRFTTAIFTNFSQDHLDYHGNMEEYWKAKKMLFAEHPVAHAVINVDDPKALELVSFLIQEQKISKNKIFGYSAYPDWADKAGIFKEISMIQATSVHLTSVGMDATVQTPWGKGTLQSFLLGRFNLSNILAALTAVCIQGMPFDQALKAIEHLTTVPGRMMCLGGENQPRVVVDYAHKPDALKQVLTELRSYCHAKLWCVFGCGGERDRKKRPLMANIAETLSDHVIITLDNPRMEAETQIFEDMLQGLKKPEAVLVEPDRVKAIQQAIIKADAGDIVLIAGRGHETVQIIGTREEPMNDYQEAIKALKGRTL